MSLRPRRTARTPIPRTRRAFAVAVVGGLLATSAPSLAAATGPSGTSTSGASTSGPSFERIATFDVEGEVAEIVAATADGLTLVHTDSKKGALGIVDLTDPAAPKAAGQVEVGGEPTSVAVLGRLALVAVAGKEQQRGDLAVVDLDAKKVVARVPLGGQPDSVTIDPKGRYAAVAVENERDEDVAKGALPQLPAGYLAVVDLLGAPSTWRSRAVDLTGLAGARFPSDPEPEFVDINDAGTAAVTLQENNAVALVDLARGAVVRSFSAGTVTHPADLTDDGDISFRETLRDARREPDGVTWTPDGNLATANEGDYDVDLAKGQFVGGRGFTVFSPTGAVLFDSGEGLEVENALRGHYDDARSDARGIEPEGVDVGVYGGAKFLFVGSERADSVGVYRLDDERHPRFVQLLPTGDAPEGLLALPQRGLVVTADEGDGTITVFRASTSADPAASVDVASPDLGRQFAALSGLAAAPGGALYAVPDGAVKPSRIYTLDPSRRPASVTGALRLTKGGTPVNYDLEGVSTRRGGGFWVVSEGTAPTAAGATENLLVAVSAAGAVEREIALPAEVSATRTGSGFEGVAESADGRFVYAAVQNAWAGDVVAGVRYARIARYEVATGAWTFARYPLSAAPAGAPGTIAIGLSEITPVGGSVFAVIERDNLADDSARVKRLYTVDFSGVAFAPAGGAIPALTKTLARDLLAAGPAGGGEEGRYRQEKAEGLARATDGRWYLVSDNDGGGETDLRSFSALSGVGAPATPGTRSAQLRPRLVGSAVIPASTFDGTLVGGLSALTYDAARGVHYALSDDRSERAPARFYTLRLDLLDGDFGPDDIEILDVTTLRRPDGAPFAATTVDPEGIALTPRGTLVITSEGDVTQLIPPFVREFALDGAQLNEKPVPEAFVPSGDGKRGVRNNAAFESATITPSGRSFFTGTEGALVQDGPASTPTAGSTTRLLRYDLATGRPSAQYAYPLGPIAAAPVPATAFATTGLVELLALDDTTLLSLERSFSTGVGNAVSLYAVSTEGATDVSGVTSLGGASGVRPVSKDLLLDLGTLGITLDNLEGLAPGPRLPDGRASLVVVADDNFSATQVTQVLVLALDR